MGRFSEPVLGEFLRKNFTMVSAPLKWTSLRPAPSVYSFDEADRQYSDARRFGIGIHGHNLCWNASNPGWFDAVLTRQNAQRILTEHINTVVSRYKGRTDSWDVVNEPIAVWHKRPDGLRRGPWLDLIGPDYIDLAFQTTKDADPLALRTLNLNGCEDQTNIGAATRTASLTLIKNLLHRGVPLQAVAVEAHIDAPWKPSDSAYLNFLRSIQDLGLQLYISELDVNDTAISGPEQYVKQVVAKTYQDYVMDVLTAVPIHRLIFWSMSDRFDWYGALAQTQSRWKRADGQPHRLGLTDENYVPNPAYEAVWRVLSTTAMRKGGVS